MSNLDEVKYIVTFIGLPRRLRGHLDPFRGPLETSLERQFFWSVLKTDHVLFTDPYKKRTKKTESVLKTDIPKTKWV